MTTCATSRCLPLDRLSQARRPLGPARGYQTWRDLLFVHWRLPAAAVAAKLPSGLSLDTWDGDAWIGLVAFMMRDVRPRWSPSVPGISHFAETNLRTYVYDRRGVPGVWFFSLEAASWVAVGIGRLGWGLNYRWAGMSVSRQGDQLEYTSRRRRRPGASAAHTQLRARLSRPSAEGEPTQPGTLAHFLTERYILYTTRRGGRLWSGQVHHSPYRVQPAELEVCQQTLLAAADLPEPGSPCHVQYSPGVDVEVFSLEPM